MRRRQASVALAALFFKPFDYMVKLVLVVCSLLLAVFSCHKPEDTTLDPDGAVIKLSHLWKTSISNNGELAEVVSEAQVVNSQGSFLVGANRDNNRYLLSLDSQTGSVDWAWSDLLPLASNPSIKDPLSINEGDYYQQGDQLTFLHGSSTYCLNLQNGATLWKHQQNLIRFPPIGGIGNSTLR